MLTSPTNKVIVAVKHKFISNITDLLKRSAIQNNSSVDPTDYVNIVGEVVSVPKRVDERFGLNGFSCDDIQVGDTAIFSHAVIYDMIPQEEGVDPIYRNRIWWEAKECFSADISLIYGVIRNGEIIMINGYVMVKPFQEAKILMAASARRAKGAVKCQVMHIGKPRTHLQLIDAKEGDWIYFNPMIATKYQINNKPFAIIQQSHVLGVEVPE